MKDLEGIQEVDDDGDNEQHNEQNDGGVEVGGSGIDGEASVDVVANVTESVKDNDVNVNKTEEEPEKESSSETVIDDTIKVE